MANTFYIYCGNWKQRNTDYMHIDSSQKYIYSKSKKVIQKMEKKNRNKTLHLLITTGKKLKYGVINVKRNNRDLNFYC